MMSSETPTEAPVDPGARERLFARFGGARIERALLGGAFVVGAVVILHVNGWRWSAPVAFLMLGWLGILTAGRFLWNAAMAAATEGEGEDDSGFEVASSRRDDLLREKRSVLKAIKEIEFDHAMDKMSQRDADELVARYRRRAIAIIKELEGGEAGSVSDIIDREVKARLAVEGAAKGAARKQARKKGKKSASAENSTRGDAEAASQAKPPPGEGADEASELGD